MPLFTLRAPFPPCGDQPAATEKLVEGLHAGERHQTLLGVTGSGKTFTMASVIAGLDCPALVISHNKTLAAQLCSEFREFFPENAVEYFVSYYDYYQPEAYIPQSDTYIEKDSSINDEIDRLRHAATQAVLERRDTIIVASVSCIYGLGSPEAYRDTVLVVEKGKELPREEMLRRLVDMHFERNSMTIERGQFRMRGDIMEIYPADEEKILRVDFFGDEVERIAVMNPVSGEVTAAPDRIVVYPAKHFITPGPKLERALRAIEEELRERIEYFKSNGKLLEAQRIEMRTRYDLELLRSLGYCNGIENYSRHLSEREPGSPPYTLIDYFPGDFVTFIDESHVTIPQLRGMLGGDWSRKKNLVEFGFRLPSAHDNRPLSFDEFKAKVKRTVFVSATPAPYELGVSSRVVEQIIRPTGLVDPEVVILPVKGQVDDLMGRIGERRGRGERVLVTTLTKKTAEDLAGYLTELGFKVRYLHCDIDTLERIQILRDLRLGLYDCLVGVNLLREGLDLPEVSLVAILDADREGFLRSETSLVQTIGRAARNVSGTVILYADTLTDSITRAVAETQRRREIQLRHNEEHGITPQSIRKSVRDILESLSLGEAPLLDRVKKKSEMTTQSLTAMAGELEAAMRVAAKSLEFEKAAALRDEMFELKKLLERRRSETLLVPQIPGEDGGEPPAPQGKRPGKRKMPRVTGMGTSR